MSAKSGQNDRIALALARGVSIVGTARQVGVSEKTIRRRLADREFAERVERLRSELLTRAVALMSNAFVDAVKQLRKLCRSGESETIRLQAARAIIQQLLPIKNETEVEQRIRAIEEELRNGTR